MYISLGCFSIQFDNKVKKIMLQIISILQLFFKIMILIIIIIIIIINNNNSLLFIKAFLCNK